MLDYTFDEQYFREYGIVCGVDEAGRGPLAGPVAAGAVVLPEGCVIEGLDDSKKLSEKKRELLYSKIVTKSLAWSVKLCSNEEIDNINILNAALLAMRKAVDEVKEKLACNQPADNLPDVKIGVVLLDGNRNTDFGLTSFPIVKGDGKSQSIAAASVLAKVTRDRIMMDMDEKYPQYNFKKHKGYPTVEHKLALYKYGPCEIHRKSFLSFLEREQDKLAALAAKAEGK